MSVRRILRALGLMRPVPDYVGRLKRYEAALDAWSEREVAIWHKYIEALKLGEEPRSPREYSHLVNPEPRLEDFPL